MSIVLVIFGINTVRYFAEQHVNPYRKQAVAVLKRTLRLKTIKRDLILR